MGNHHLETKRYAESTQSDTESGSREELCRRDTVISFADERDYKRRMTTRNCCKYLGLLCCVVLVSVASSFITTKYFTELPLPIDSVQHEETSTDDENHENEARNEKNNVLPIPERQIQKKTSKQARTGAQVTANHTLLHGDSSQLQWSHKGPNGYLDGINHVTYDKYDCLEITMNDRYLITIQITYIYRKNTPETEVHTYFTLVRFRDHVPSVIAKSDHMVPSPKYRSNKNLVPQTMVLSDRLQKDDLLCVTASHPELIYASNIDNFFGIVSI